ncbi:MAG: hypothetical protein DHS20C05_07790 [Hyphococcus sp.]|nr:MAG: hypothetical protein DHS20C05_07790 [Marinicaulis sp.]
MKRSATVLKTALVALIIGAVSGCLVSETPVLDASNGAATPLGPGDYVSCPVDDEAEESDCEDLKISHDASGLYSAVTSSDEAMEWRFRRVARGGYAVQVKESDGYAYYYGRMAGEALRMTFMQCPSLPADLRASLIRRGDLATEDEDDFETCAVNTVRGLSKSAKAYHKGKAVDEDPLTLMISPVTTEISLQTP